MPHSLRGQSVPEAICDQVEQDIAAGVLSQFMPGSKELAKRYGVSKGSVCTALKRLEKRGLIESGQRGRKRRILKSDREPNAKRRQVLLCVRSDSDWLDADDEAIWQEMIAKVWRADDNEVVDVIARGSKAGQVKHLIAQWLEEFSPDRIAVITGTQLWLQTLVATEIPVFSVGGELRGVMPQISGYAARIGTIFELALTQLRKQGHTRILLPQPSERSIYSETAISSYREIFGDLYNDEEIQALCPSLPLPDVLDWQRWWWNTLAQTKATAVVSARETEVMSLIASCMTAGIQIPKDLKIVVASDSRALSWLAPIVQRVTHDQRIAIKLFKQWVNEGQPAFHFLQPEWHDIRG